MDAGRVGAHIEPRLPVKLRGRTVAVEELRTRCMARVKEGRALLLERLRDLASEADAGDCMTSGALRGVAREVIMSEACVGDGAGDSNITDHSEECDEVLDFDTLLELEDALIRELEEESMERAAYEAQRYLDEQNEADAALFEQHLLGGVPCPLCGAGRLTSECGEIRCTACADMGVALMDEAMPMDEVSELLGIAEDCHWRSGCTLRGCFEVVHEFGTPMLFFSCAKCGWREVVL
mmetsp:Transcript_20869/g.58299  ORF Transcript_20869/g.58299 Transcript_20869/m.58299 type:complete len:237 (-) Transcript_20869:110-820(-)